MEKDVYYNYVIATFKDLENRLIDCMEYIPFSEKNKNVTSPKFVSMILDSCSLIESLFCEFATENKRKRNLKQYCEIIEPENNFSTTISIFLIHPIRFMSPFAFWVNKIPSWWQAYNKLKHDRISNYEFATYDNTINSLVGLHQVISKIKHLIPNLFIAGWLNTDNVEGYELMMANEIGRGVGVSGIIPVTSNLFVSPLEENFVKINKNRLTVNWDCEFTKRVQNLLSIEEYLEYL